jgi:hypothetical protein
MNYQLRKKIKILLGCDILEHDLIIGDTKTINEIKVCMNIRQVNEILHQRHAEVYGKPKSLPGDRYLYWKYKGENSPNFVAL